MRERHVTRAAEKLHLSQPALSHALKRLREAKAQEARADWTKVRQWDDDDDWGEPPADDQKR